MHCRLLVQLYNGTGPHWVMKNKIAPGTNMKWSSLEYQHNEIIKPFVSFHLSKLW